MGLWWGLLEVATYFDYVHPIRVLIGRAAGEEVVVCERGDLPAAIKQYGPVIAGTGFVRGRRAIFNVRKGRR
jgi:hypothetical protein